VKFGAATLILLAWVCPSSLKGAQSQPIDGTKNDIVQEARRARDHADVKALIDLVNQIRERLSQENAFEDYLRIALFQD
jgi:hypothetical protein